MLSLVKSVQGEDGLRLWSAAWSSDGKRVAVSGEDKTVGVYTSSSWECVERITDLHTRTVRFAAWSPNGRLLACCSFDGSVSVMETNEFECIARLEGHENEVKCVAWSSCGTLLATCGRDKTVWIWEVMGEGELECVSVLHGHAQDVKHVKWHPTARVLFSASYDDTIKVWVEEDYEWYCINTLSGHTSTVWGLDFDPSGNWMVSCSDDKSIILWSRDTSQSDECRLTVTCLTRVDEQWQIAQRFEGAHSRSIYSISWSSNGLIASGGGDNKICLFSCVDNKLQFKDSILDAHKGDINCVTWSPFDPSTLVSCGDDAALHVYRLSKHK